MPSSRLTAALSVVAVTAALAAVAVARPSSDTPTARMSSHVVSLTTLFSDNVFLDNVFLGGQVAPRQYRWANREASLFVQFDRPPPEAKTLRYIGIGVRGTFCAETQQRGANAGFTHFHRPTAPVYAASPAKCSRASRDLPRSGRGRCHRPRATSCARPCAPGHPPLASARSASVASPAGRRLRTALVAMSTLARAAWGSVCVTTIKGFAMRAKVVAATAVLGLAAAGATGILVPGLTEASRLDATAAQDRAALAIVQAKAFTRSVRLRRRAPLAGWGVRNTSQVDATAVETCVEFPSGFEIRYKPADRPPGVKITNGKRKACIPIQGSTIYVDSSSGFLVEGFAPRRVGTYKVKLTATASNAATARKTVNLRILRRCTRQRCPGFPGS